MKREIIFYRKKSGECPIEDFLESLNGKVAQKIIWTLQLLEDIEKLPGTYFKKLVNTDGLWECRIKFSSNIYRILCFFENGKVVVLTHGFIKKTQKTPHGEIEKAKRYKNDYIQRRKK